MSPLRQRMSEDLRLRGYAARTQQTYLAHVRRFARHFGRSPDELGSAEIRTYQLHLVEQGASWSLLGQASAAVSFTYKDYAHGGREETMRLAPCEFLRRLLLHVLPRGFVRIRRCGLLANCQREKQLARCRTLLAPAPATPAAPADGEPAEQAQSCPTEAADEAEAEACQGQAEPEPRCPACGEGRLRTIEILPPLLRHSHPRWSRAPPLPRSHRAAQATRRSARRTDQCC